MIAIALFVLALGLLRIYFVRQNASSGIIVSVVVSPAPFRLGREDVTIRVADGSGRAVGDADVRLIVSRYVLSAGGTMGATEMPSSMTSMSSETLQAAPAENGSYRASFTILQQGTWSIVTHADSKGRFATALVNGVAQADR
ncbi:MAG: hypothetical protein ACYC8W_11875 [Candidatus Tyrphobacter sp.]